ncbi:MAG TPA: hypothetical protein VHW23_36205 [Kofleriaceae bacterium]|nr:hypothetical protein [Kofleriaceae bacterium]
MARSGRRRGLAVALAAVASMAVFRDGPATAPGVTRVARAGATAPDPQAAHEPALAQLRAQEQQRRASTDFATLPPSDVAFGPDPYRIAALPDGRAVGVLRGESAVVVLDQAGAAVARAREPISPGGLAVSPAGDILVVGERARGVIQYRMFGNRLVRLATLPVDALGLRDVALAPDGNTAYVVEERDGRLLAVSLARGRGDGQPDRGPADAAMLRATGVRELSRCHGPIQVAAVAGDVMVDCLLDHAIEIRRPDGTVARIVHDGPIWRFAARAEPDGGLLIAAGGVEDHPLEREDGGFGYIDSFVYLYRLAPDATAPVRLAAINSSELGVVTPRWIELGSAPGSAGAGAVTVTAAGYATPNVVTLTWRGGFTARPEVATTELVPGITAAARVGGALIAADPLLDAWIVTGSGPPRVVPASGPPSALSPSRIGELLFFTTLMSPWNSSDGKLSRFTCETCHHEGYVDGRVHFTGRGRVFAATRPLLGLGNLRPYFSRALDKTMTDMVHAEFRVANRHNGRDPWFALTRADVPWLARVPGAPAALSPEQLRGALMAFFGDFTHRANPAASDHAAFTPRELEGAQVFRDRCAGCHAPRLIADDPSSAVPFAAWQHLVLSPSGPIVWSNAEYAKTGVEPYVNDRGARVAPLRRLYKKWPYFTNGSVRSLDEVLDRFAWTPTAAYHDGAPDPVATPLTASEKSALLAFLALL